MPTIPPGPQFTTDPADFDDWPQDVLGHGGDLSPSLLISAYRIGLFPMGLGEHGTGPIGWWTPQRRGVLLAGDHRVHRSLRRARRDVTTSVDRAFRDVVLACADPSREGRWITDDVVEAYCELHRLGWAHSVEVWADGDLVGGLYGVGIGGLFAGESMFHRRTDASKVALWAACDVVFDDSDEASAQRIFDVQWRTPHLERQGVREIPRADYRARLQRAVLAPEPEGWSSEPIDQRGQAD